MRPDALQVQERAGALHIEALWLLEDSGQPSSPLERLVARDALPSQRFGLRPETGTGPRLGASLAVERGAPAMALLCRQGVALASLGALAEHCLLAQVDAEPDLLRNHMHAARAGLELRDAVGGVDLSFGLFWLRSDGLARDFGIAGFGLQAPAFAPELRGAEFGLSRSFALGDEWRLVLGGRVGQQEWRSPLFASPLQSRVLDVSLAFELGDFSGLVSGRRLLPAEASGPALQVLDLGFSWRTPWAGRLSVGAHNLLGSKPAAGQAAQAFGFAPEADLLDELPQGRVPFVRYRQDL